MTRLTWLISRSITSPLEPDLTVPPSACRPSREMTKKKRQTLVMHHPIVLTDIRTETSKRKTRRKHAETIQTMKKPRKAPLLNLKVRTAVNWVKGSAKLLNVLLTISRERYEWEYAAWRKRLILSQCRLS